MILEASGNRIEAPLVLCGGRSDGGHAPDQPVERLLQGDLDTESATPSSIAPKVIRMGSRSPASDLFALGATLYEAAEGRRPFDDATPIATTLAVLHRSPTPARHGKPVGQVIDGLLTKDPRLRLGALDAFAWLKEIESELMRPRATEPARTDHQAWRCRHAAGSPPAGPGDVSPLSRPVATVRHREVAPAASCECLLAALV
jgi:serine/threonine protein kinase